MNVCVLATPFSFATVVVADNYVDTFPHPQGLIAYLHRLFVQLEVEIVSLERPVTIKGSWKTIIKIDSFLKTLISTLHSAISKGEVPSEDDFNQAFTHFEEENNHWSEPIETKQPTSLKNKLKSKILDAGLYHHESNSSNNIYQDDHQYSDSTLQNPEAESSLSASACPGENIIIDKNPHDKWYFNVNPRGKTGDKTRKRYSNSGQTPPEPIVIVETEGTSKFNQPSITEIEQVLCQVYNKETIKKFQKKSLNEDNDLYAQDKKKMTLPTEKKNTVKEEINVFENVVVEESTITGTSHNLIKPSQERKESILRKRQQKSKDGIKVIATKETKINMTPLNVRDSGTTIVNISKQATGKRKPNTEIIYKRQSVRQKLKAKNNNLNLKDDNLPSNSDIKTRKSKEANKNSVAVKFHQSTNASKKNCKYAFANETTNTIYTGNGKVPSKMLNEKGKQKCRRKENDVKKTEKKADTQVENVKKKRGRRSQEKEDLSDSRFECDQCLYETSKFLQLVEHKRRIHLTKTFTCEICFKEFGYRKDLRRHMICHSKAENCCNLCGKMYKDVKRLTDHKKIHTEGYIKPQFSCKFCSKSFSTKYVLAYHIKSNHLGMKRSYICPTCGKSFSQKSSYLQHANVHMGIRPYTCEECGKTFSYVKSLKEHRFMHKDERVFTCNICEKSFQQASGLAIHAKVHKATKDYVCSMCGKGFSQRQAMVRHERIHAGEKPYECGMCHRAFADSSVLRRHMILIHKKDPKMWKEDTICQIQKKNDFFVSVINANKSPDQHRGPVHVEQHQEQCSQESNSAYQPNYEIGQELPVKEFQGSDFHIEEEQFVTVSLAPNSESGDATSQVKEEPVYTPLSDPTSLREHYGNSHFNELRSVVTVNASDETQSINNHRTVNSNECNLESLQLQFPSPQFTIQNSTNQLQNIISVAPHLVGTLSEQHMPSMSAPAQLASAHTESTQQFVPAEYTQSYDTGCVYRAEMPQVQYATVMPHSFAQTIVVLQDNLNIGTITYHHPNVNVSLSDEPISNSIHLQNTSQSP